MEFSRITSGFTLARFHPILQDVARAQGRGLRARRTGTPVRATADGVVDVRGLAERLRQRRSSCATRATYSTVYGHLSRFAAELKTGARVAQGDTIGYVGMTGWATGPHLHYEFRVADQPRDPLSLALPIALAGHARAPAPRSGRRIAPLVDSLALARSLPGAALAARE